MTTPTFKVRLSPSGRFIGKPGLLYGPGSPGRAWRHHGAGSAQTIPTAAATAITGMDVVPVDILPGYLYDNELFYVVETLGVTVSANLTAYYRLRNASTSAWGSWVPMANSVHTIRGVTTYASQQAFLGDDTFGLSVTAGGACNAIEFGLLGWHVRIAGTQLGQGYRVHALDSKAERTSPRQAKPLRHPKGTRQWSRKHSRSGSPHLVAC
jgi:hypothetical protein